jgi:ABC-type uncharacterized transport system permease subunit
MNSDAQKQADKRWRQTDEGKEARRAAQSLRRKNNIKTDAELRALARSYTPEGIRILAAVARDENQPGQTRINAVKMMMDRGWGRPSETHNINLDGEQRTLLKVVNEIVHVHETREQIEFRDQVPLLELPAEDGDAKKPN